VPLKIELDKYGFRIGSLKSRAADLYSYGATREEVTAALGSTQLKVLTELESKGFVIHKKRIRVGKNRPHYRYTIGDKNEKVKT
jgi:hypothetical protein